MHQMGFEYTTREAPLFFSRLSVVPRAKPRASDVKLTVSPNIYFMRQSVIGRISAPPCNVKRLDFALWDVPEYVDFS